MADETDVVNLLALAAGAHGRAAEATDDVVRGVVSAAERLLDGCVACSVTEQTPQDGAAFRTPASSNLLGVTLDRAQYAAGDGPCVQACRDGRVHQFSLADEHSPYPALAAVARRHGVRASLSVPVPGTRVPAALNLYSATWPTSGAPPSAAAVAAFMARCAATVLGAAPTPVASVEVAGRRRLVHDAMHAFGAPCVGDTAAFGLLARRSRDEHRSIFAVARDVITGTAGADGPAEPGRQEHA